MATVTLWLLVSIGWVSTGAPPTLVVERFADVAECQRVLKVLSEHWDRKGNRSLRCVQATVVKP